MRRDSARHKAISETPAAARQYSPAPNEESSSVSLHLSETTIEVSRQGRGPVCLRFGVSTAHPLAVAERDVTHWCAETSVLLEVTLVVTRGDELQIRSPMLVGEDGRCLAIVRRITEAGSEFSLALATSATAMQQDSRELTICLTASELKDVLAILRGASAASQLP